MKNLFTTSQFIIDDACNADRVTAAKQVLTLSSIQRLADETEKTAAKLRQKNLNHISRTWKKTITTLLKQA